MLKKLAVLAFVGLISVGCANFSAPKGALGGAVLGAGIGAVVGGIAVPGFGAGPGAAVGAGGGAILGALGGQKDDTQPQPTEGWQGEQTGSYDEHGVYRGTYSGEYTQ